jgi:hypothetical protein
MSCRARSPCRPRTATRKSVSKCNLCIALASPPLNPHLLAVGGAHRAHHRAVRPSRAARASRDAGGVTELARHALLALIARLEKSARYTDVFDVPVSCTPACMTAVHQARLGPAATEIVKPHRSAAVDGVAGRHHAPARQRVAQLVAQLPACNLRVRLPEVIIAHGAPLAVVEHLEPALHLALRVEQRRARCGL